MKFFRSLCRIKTQSRPVIYTGVWVQIAEQEMYRCTVHSKVDWVESRLSPSLVDSKKNVIVESQLYDVADVQFTVDWVESLSLVESTVYPVAD